MHRDLSMKRNPPPALMLGSLWLPKVNSLLLEKKLPLGCSGAPHTQQRLHPKCVSCFRMAAPVSLPQGLVGPGLACYCPVLGTAVPKGLEPAACPLHSATRWSQCWAGGGWVRMQSDTRGGRTGTVRELLLPVGLTTSTLAD